MLADPYTWPPPSHFDSKWWAVKSRKTFSPLSLLSVVRKGSMLYAQSSGLWCWGSCLPLFFFHNRQNNLGFLWELRLLHSWMAVLRYCVSIRRCSYTSRRTCQRELSTEFRMTCAMLNFYNFWYAWKFCTYFSLYYSPQSATNCALPQNSFPDRKWQPPHSSWQEGNTS